MDENGQTYFDSEDAIPEADRKRYIESLREEEERVRARLAAAERDARRKLEELVTPETADRLSQAEDKVFLGADPVTRDAERRDGSRISKDSAMREMWGD